MKNLLSIIGIVLIILGIIGVSYKYFTYTTNEKIAEIGNVQITAEKEKTVVISPMLGGLAIVAGFALIIIARSR
ncbi:MAG: DUF3185 domain-containing protein [Gammaproteobacteria bacterium]|nr:MAG: DUF3185 domain-containing protein [Gammaproteobacteria bacterium]